MSALTRRPATTGARGRSNGQTTPTGAATTDRGG
jgi:hypothetical protein